MGSPGEYRVRGKMTLVTTAGAVILLLLLLLLLLVLREDTPDRIVKIVG